MRETSIRWLAPPNLEWLFVAHAKHLTNLKFLEGAHGLRSLGVEGNTYTRQAIDSLAPIAGLQKLENLFMTSTRLVDKDLTALTTIPNLKVLACARFAPKEQFDSLRRAKPDLECRWCDKYEIDG